MKVLNFPWHWRTKSFIFCNPKGRDVAAYKCAIYSTPGRFDHMSKASVRDILQQIERLSDEDRLDLSVRLADRQEDEWKAEADIARAHRPRNGNHSSRNRSSRQRCSSRNVKIRLPCHQRFTPASPESLRRDANYFNGRILYCPRLRLTLTRSVREVAKSLSRLRFGLVWIRTISTAGSIPAAR